MDEVRLAELLAPFLAARQPDLPKPVSLAQSQLEDILTYIDLLLRWNARINLTAVRRPEEIVTRHFGESLFAARHLFPEAPGRPDISPAGPPHLADLGSGAGFPGLPVKIWAPFIRLTLIESNQKKATFLREVVRAIRLTDVNVFAERLKVFGHQERPTRISAAAPARSPLPGKADVVTLRAVERFEAILPAAASLLSPDGRLAFLLSSSQVPSTSKILPHYRWSTPAPIPLSGRRVLLIGTRQQFE